MIDEATISCPRCAWSPDGRKQWQCTCGHVWDTFATRGRCPNCARQWETTACPGCGNAPRHEDWYPEGRPRTYPDDARSLRLRSTKHRIEKRLIAYGIRDHRFADLDRLDGEGVSLRDARTAARRMLVLCAVAFAAYAGDERIAVITWLGEEDLWDELTDDEETFLLAGEPSEKLRHEMCWNGEAALTLAWCLQIIPSLPALDDEDTEAEVDRFLDRIPGIGEPTAAFIGGLRLRHPADIYEENVLNEAVTAHFRDDRVAGRTGGTAINRARSYQRHFVLNWLRGKTVGAGYAATETST